MKQPIGSRLHGLLDYLTGTGLVAASRLPALRGRFAGRALAGAGLSHVAYSLVTDYELGLVKRLPYRAHLGLDAAGALGLAAAGATRRAPVDCLVPVAVGAYELGAVLLSDPSGAPRGPERHAVTVGRSEAEVRAFLADPANVEGFSPEGQWSGSFELRRRPRRARHGDPRDGASGGPPARQADARGGRAGHGRRPGGSPRRPERGPPEARHGQGREVKAVTWAAPNRVACEATPDPSLVNRRDAILKVTATTICGSDPTSTTATCPRCSAATSSATSSWGRW